MKTSTNTSHARYLSQFIFLRFITALILLVIITSTAFGQKKKKEPKGNQPDKITICHNGETIEISTNALQAHLDHGDSEGSCVVENLNGDILPYYNPPNGKVEEEIGAELTSLLEQYIELGSLPSDDIYVLSGDKVLIEIVAEDAGSLQTILDALAGYDVVIYEDYPNEDDLIITVLFPMASLADLNNDPAQAISFVRPVYTPILKSGVVISQGDKAIQSDIARKAFGVDGSNVKICVMSDSYDAKQKAQGDVSNGDLPADVDVSEDYPSEFGAHFYVVDEGRAMLQIIHDVAPAADLGFRTGFVSIEHMANGIQILQDEHACDIIVDDITHLSEPFFRDGLISDAVNEVTDLGVKYFSSAGNFADWGFESQYTPVSGNESYHDFDGTGNINQQVKFGEAGTYIIVFQWDDVYKSLGGAGNTGALNDLDISLVDEQGNTLVSLKSNNLGGDPIEVMPIRVENGGAIANIVIERASGTENVNFKYIVFVGGQNFTILDGAPGVSTIVGQANAAGTYTVGAANFASTPAYGVDPPIVESFSSYGGTIIDGVDRQKPDFIAPDRVNTSVTSIGPDTDGNGDPFSNFVGTSAAAPHAAAVAALISEAISTFEVVDMDVGEIMKETALAMNSTGEYDKVTGQGFVLADAAIMSFAAPKPSITELVDSGKKSPGQKGYKVTIKGENLTGNSKVILDSNPLPDKDVTFVDQSTITAKIPAFTGDPLLQVYTPFITPSERDGGLSNAMSFFFVPKRVITVTADNDTKLFGELNPDFAVTLLVDGLPLAEAESGLPADEFARISNFEFEIITSANEWNSPTGIIYYIRPSLIIPIEGDDPTNDYDFKYVDGQLTIERMLLTIKPILPTIDGNTYAYGDNIDNITFEYDLYSDGVENNENIDNLVLLLEYLQVEHQSTFREENVNAIVDRGRQLVNRGRQLVNGSGWLLSESALTNRGRQLVNGDISIDLDIALLIDYEVNQNLDGTIPNRGRQLVNGELFYNNESYIKDELGNRGRQLVNEGGIGTSESNGEGFGNIILIIDETDATISNIYSVNLISGLDVNTSIGNSEDVGADAIQYVVPGAFISPAADNFIISYKDEEFNILPAILNVAVDDKQIIDGDPLPEFTSTILGFEYGENEAEVFSSITYNPASYDGLGVYPIVPTLVFADQVNYVFDPDPIDPGTLTVTGTNGRIAFAHFNDSNNLGIGLVDSDGYNPVSLPVEPEGIRDPQFSPDGNQIVFTKSPTISADVSTPSWSSAGPGTVTLTDGDMDNNGAQFTYNLNPAGFSERSWTFTSVATGDEPFELAYDWSGFHAFFQVTTTLQITDQNGTRVVDNIQPGGAGGPDSCCGGVSAGFNHSGTVLIDPVFGQPITFTLKGSNGDSNNVLQGTFTISITTPSLSDLQPPDDQGLWRVNADGSGLTELTTGINNHSSSFSPNGTKIGFIKDNEIAIMNADGTGTVILTSSGTSKRWTAFSADGQEIIYVRSDEDIYTDSFNSIWKVNINTQSTEQISPVDSELYYRSPVFLKDGSKIIYVRHDNVGETPTAIMSMNPDGSGQTALLISEAITNDVDVSPDNTKLAFSLQAVEGVDYTLNTMDINGANVEEIYGEPNLVLWPSWGSSGNLDGDFVNIPDPNFEQALIDLSIDSDGIINQRMLISEAREVTSLNISDPVNNPNLPNVSDKIVDLTGIEAFVNLSIFEFQYNEVATVDLSHNTALTELYAWDNQLTNLDVSQNGALRILNCDLNQLNSLDLTKNPALIYLSCSDNNLTSLDVTQNTALIELYCVNNQLPSLDVTKNYALGRLNCDINQLTELDVSQNLNLSELYCAQNQLTSLDVRNGNNANFIIVYAINNNLSCISVDDQNADHSVWEVDEGVVLNNDCSNTVSIPDPNFEQALIDLGIDSDGMINQQVYRSNVSSVYSLDISYPETNVNLPNVNAKISDLTGIEAFSNLEILKCQNNLLTTLDMNQNVALVDLDFSNNQVTDLNITACSALEILVFDNNLLTELNILQNTALIAVRCEYNQLTEIDVSKNLLLTSIFIEGNQISTLDVTNNTALIDLSVYGNLLTSLDVTQNTALVQLQCGDNELTVLDISNNTLLTGLFCDFNELTTLDLTRNTEMTVLSCVFNSIDDLDLTQNLSMRFINAGSNELTELDVSQNTLFEVLYLSENQLTELDISQNGALIELAVDNNQLTSLDARNGNNANFTRFNATANNLNCISVDDENADHSIWLVDEGVSYSNDCSNTGYSGARTITGTVTASDTGEPFIGASILLKGTTTGTITNIDGQYALNIAGNDDILTISFIGFAAVEEIVGDRIIVDIELGEAPEGLSNFESSIVQGNFTIYPNPVVDYMQVVHADESVPVADMSVVVYDQSGAVQQDATYMESLVNHGLVVDMTQLPAGYYIVHVNDLRVVEVIRVQKE